MRSLIAIATVLAAACSGAGAAETPPTFTGKPTAARAGGAVKIEFTLSRETDVAVYVLDAGGKVVRHLVAGALGKNPPAPLKPGLKQSIAWDLKDDDGKPAAGGPFRVRVAAGMKVDYAGTAFSRESGPNHMDCVVGMAAGPDGRLYVLGYKWQWLHWCGTAVHVFRRDGSYERTIRPFPANLPPERLKYTSAFRDADGRLVPVVHRMLGTTFYPFEDYSRLGDMFRAQQPAVTPEGHFLTASLAATEGGAQWGRTPHLSAIDGEGGLPWGSCAGPVLLDGGGFTNPHLAASSDGKHAYVTGMGPKVRVPNCGWVGSNAPVVWRVKLPERGPAEVFFGQQGGAGGDGTHLKEPEGIAVDGKGHLYVADKGNNRVVVIDEKNAKSVGSFAVPAPEWVGVDSATGAVYVHSGKALLKFSPSAGSGPAGWKNAREAARLQLPVSSNGRYKSGNWSFAVDASARPAVLWLASANGRTGTPVPLWRCEDQGSKLTDPQPAGCYGSPVLWSLSRHPRRAEVSCKDMTRRPNRLLILDEDASEKGKPVVQSVHLSEAGGTGWIYRLGAEDQIYGQSTQGIAQLDRKGKPVPFPKAAPREKFQGRLAGASGTTAWERDFGVARNGDLYVKTSGCRYWGDVVYHGYMSIEQYGPDGAHKRTALWCLSDGAVGPRIDPRGNIYVCDEAKPLDRRWPAIFDGHLPKWSEEWYNWTCGSVIKFGPQGGAFWLPLKNGKDKYPFKGEPKLDPKMAREKVGHHRMRQWGNKPGELQGALWWRFGCSAVLNMHGHGSKYCHCTGTDFDVDDFGRSFYPDPLRFRVGVLDTNGNEILHFGAYGNQDFCGPDSYVLDPKGKYYRPRKPGDPEDLVSPFAEPEIAIGWIVGMAVTDRYAYVADSLNRRVLRCRLGYVAEETCTVGAGTARRESRGPASAARPGAGTASPAASRESNKSEPPKASTPATARPTRSPAQVCTGWFSAAENYKRIGMKADARRCLGNIIEKHPDTDWAAQARRELKRL